MAEIAAKMRQNCSTKDQRQLRKLWIRTTRSSLEAKQIRRHCMFLEMTRMEMHLFVNHGQWIPSEAVPPCHPHILRRQPKHGILSLTRKATNLDSLARTFNGQIHTIET